MVRCFKVMRITHDEELRCGQHADQKGLLLFLALQEFRPPEHMGVDFASNLIRDAREETRYHPQSDVPDQQQVYVALSGFLATGEGAEHEGPLDLRMRQGGSQHVCETTCFQDEAVDLGVEGMRSVRRVGDPIPILAGGDESEPTEFLEFLLYRPHTRSRTALNLPRMKRAAGRAEQEAKNLGAGAG